MRKTEQKTSIEPPSGGSFFAQKKFLKKIDFGVRSFSIFCTYISERLFLPEYRERRKLNV